MRSMNNIIENIVCYIKAISRYLSHFPFQSISVKRQGERAERANEGRWKGSRVYPLDGRVVEYIR
jgi:hypothetical protein